MPGKFTVISDSKVDSKIESDLVYIQTELLKEFGDRIVALVLVGGFGRQEGGVLLEGHQVYPVNDYDIVLIQTEGIDLKRIQQTRERLANDLGIRWVDISVYTISKLRKLRFTMYHYDLKYGGYVFYGRQDVLSLIPPMDPVKMPLVEAETQFFTRMWCFLGPFSIGYLTAPPDDIEEIFFLKTQFSKAILACSDALLILEGHYHLRYSERLRRFEQLFSTRYDLVTEVRQATQFKLLPHRIKSLDVVARWFQVRQLFLQTMEYFVARMYQREFHGWEHYANAYRNQLNKRIYRFAYILIKRSYHFEHLLSINLAQLFLILALDEDGVQHGWLDLALDELGRIKGRNKLHLSWDNARQLAVDLRMKI